MRILAIDLGKFKSVACVYETNSREHRFETVATTPSAIHDLIVKESPDRIVIEIGSQAGWVCDLARTLEIQILVANTNHEAWRWKNVKRKTGRDDALKLAQLSAMGQLPTVTVPKTQVRQWRILIAYRHTLVSRRTAIKNHIRSVLDRQGLTMTRGHKGWNRESVAALRQQAKPLSDADSQDLWRCERALALVGFEQVNTRIGQVEEKLEALAKQPTGASAADDPWGGPRLSELIVATIDDPKRFANAKQVGAYAGRVPRLFESGTMHRQGRITGRGNKLLRALLVEVSWLMQRYNPWLKDVYERVCRGSKSRRKIAVIACARRLLIRCWAMLRDGTDWRMPEPVAAT